MFNREPLWARLRQPATYTAKADGGVLVASPNQQHLLDSELERIKKVRMHVENGSVLAIGYFPAYVYNPQWAGLLPSLGLSCKEPIASDLRVTRVEGSRLYVQLNTSSGPHTTPPMTWYTCFLKATWPWLPVPALPPGVWIDIRTEKLEGWIDTKTGEVSFEYVSSFVNHALWATNPSLAVAARMTTAEQRGEVFHATGEHLRAGRCKLVAISRVPATDDPMQNAILQLPTDALSVLNTRFDFMT